jgi:hypothetical protein
VTVVLAMVVESMTSLTVVVMVVFTGLKIVNKFSAGGTMLLD